MDTVSELLRQMEFTAKLHRLAVEGKHPYKSGNELHQEFDELRLRAESLLEGTDLLMARLLVSRIADEVGCLNRSVASQSP